MICEFENVLSRFNANCCGKGINIVSEAMYCVYRMMHEQDGVLTLAVWWAVWSLGDVYLLPYTPCSELVVLLLCVLWLLVPFLFKKCRAAFSDFRKTYVTKGLQRL